MSAQQVRANIEARRDSSTADIPDPLPKGNPWKWLKKMLMGVKGLPPYFAADLSDINDEQIRRIFALPDAMHALAGFLHKVLMVAIGRLPKADKELITQWAVTECLSHSTGKMYRYSWVVYALDMVLPRDLTRQSRWDPRPVDLPLESQNMILTTLQLRLWLYFNPFDSRHCGIIFSSHGGLIHFLSAAQVFADACCTDPSCGCGEQESDEEEEDDENAMMEEDDEESSGDEDSSEEAEDESQDESFVPEKASSSVANTP